MTVTTAAAKHLTTEEQRSLIAVAQDVPMTVTTTRTEAGKEVERVTYGTTSAADAAMTELFTRFEPIFKSVANTAANKGILDFDEARAICIERFVKAVREHDLTSPVPFSTSLWTLLKFEVSDQERTNGRVIRVAENVAARYFRLLHKHEGDIQAAYEECRTTANGFDPSTFLAVHQALAMVQSLDWGTTNAGGSDGEVNEDGEEAEFSRKEEALIDIASNFDEQIANRDLVNWVLAQLTDRDRTIVRLRYGFSDLATANLRSAAGFRNDSADLVMTDEQVAQVVGSRTSTVSKRRREALAAMKAALDSLLDDENAA